MREILKQTSWLILAQVITRGIGFFYTIFLATPGVQVMLSTEKYLKSVIGFSIFALLFNVILNLIFIPQFGFLAAAWITVLSDAISFLIFFLYIKFKILRS